MRSTRNKTTGFLLCLLVFAGACRKVTLESEGKFSNRFDSEAREFIFAPTAYLLGYPVQVSIPEGAVSSPSYLEYYQYLLDDHNSINSYYVNDTLADINLFVSDGNTLLKPATLQIPFYFTASFDTTSGYKPYHVKASSYTDLMLVLNNDANWTPITNFTFDNASKKLIFETNDLNGIYVVAKHK